ncbi:anti-sigma factor family protein [Streptomyces chartreusis]|uniref:anti-sigma factor family protein n=1 Tax=Streptomyces chartreusis TaxID=1969 RepID=UPI0036AB8385
MLLGVYVLGGLSETERLTFDRHVADCTECRGELTRSAALPGLLRRGFSSNVPMSAERNVQDFLEGDSVDAAPASLGRLLMDVRAQEIRRRGRHRWTWLALAAALIVVVGLSVSLLKPGSNAESPPSLALSASDSSTVSGRATLAAKPWGTAVTLDISGLPARGPFTLWVMTNSGRREQAAVWGPTQTGRVHVTGATSATMPQIASVSVLDHAGRMLAVKTV